MTTIVSIDPGLWNLPWCVWLDGALTHCGLSRLKPKTVIQSSDLPAIAAWHYSGIRFDCLTLAQTPPDHVYIEQLSLNSGRDSTRGKALSTGNALLQITSVAALVAGHLRAPVTYVPVRTWLGTAPPSVTKARVLKTLDPDELQILQRAIDALPHRKGKESSLAHNLYDAAGLGLWATGRYRIR